MDYFARLKELQKRMAAASIDLVFLPITADLAYLTGIARDMPNFGATLYNGRWMEGAFIGKEGTPIITLPRMTAEFHAPQSEVGEVRVLPDKDDPFAFAKSVLDTFKLGAQPRVAMGNFAWAEATVALQNLLPGAIFSNASDLMRPMRRIKSAEELAVLREAGEVTEKAFAAVLKKLKIGMNELEICAEVDLQMRLHGAIGPSFTTSMYNSGPNHLLGLGHDNQNRTKPLVGPVSLLFDFGAGYNNYCYDYGRTVFFGEPTAEAIKIHRTIMDSQAAGIAALKAGSVTCEQVDRAARKVVEEAGYGKYFRHRLGHGIGMDVHEPPFLMETDATPVEEGMCFTIEPSILISGGFAARVEDIIVARPGGGEPLTTGYQDLIVVS